MSGVDLCDYMISIYSMSSHTKKWTIGTVLYFFDMLPQTAGLDSSFNGDPVTVNGNVSPTTLSAVFKVDSSVLL